MTNVRISVVRKKIKHIYIRVYSDARVVVSAPLYISDQSIQEFILSKQHWINEKVNQQSVRHYQNTRIDEMKPSSFQLWGEQYPLQYNIDSKNSFSVIDNVGVVSLTKNAPSTKTRILLNEFYRDVLKNELEQQVALYESIVGVTVNEVRTKIMKTRWGTCNINAKRLWFNVLLAHFPKSCTEYVVVHEMTHLHERYHNKRFYHLVNSAMPDWKIWHDYLKNAQISC
ncbi:MAG: M48 family metallopeptidase [Gammaproteobacteria bacterium]|nr:M48 family metallopeptidase [Gammaproteobacteria bacterium]